MGIAALADRFNIQADFFTRIRYTDGEGNIFNCNVLGAIGDQLSVCVEGDLSSRFVLHPNDNIVCLPDNFNHVFANNETNLAIADGLLEGDAFLSALMNLSGARQ